VSPEDYALPPRKLQRKSQGIKTPNHQPKCPTLVFQANFWQDQAKVVASTASTFTIRFATEKVKEFAGPSEALIVQSA